MKINGLELSHPIDAWFRKMGMRFNPFLEIEASGDAQLSRYWVGNDAFTQTWAAGPVWVLAPTGGGKTALRAHVTQSCFVPGPRPNRPFPLPYNLPYLGWKNLPPSQDDYWDSLSQNGSAFLLVSLTSAPQWFERLARSEQARVRRIFDWCLPRPLDAYAKPALETGSLDAIYRLFAPAFLPADREPIEAAAGFLRKLAEMPSVERKSRPGPRERWDQLVSVILDMLEYPSLLIQVDGVDAILAAAENPTFALDILEPLLARTASLARQKIYLKAYLPAAMEIAMMERLPEMAKTVQVVSIQWSPAELAELIRRRVFVASEGALNTMTLLAEPDVRDLEFRLAHCIPPLPREMLVITGKLIQLAAQRPQPEAPLRLADLAAVERWYQNEYFNPA